MKRALVLCKSWGCSLPGIPKDGEAAPSIKLASGEEITRASLLEMIHNSKKPGNGPDLRKQAEDQIAAEMRVAARGTKSGEVPTLASVL